MLQFVVASAADLLQEREIEKVNVFYLQKEAEVSRRGQSPEAR